MIEAANAVHVRMSAEEAVLSSCAAVFRRLFKPPLTTWFYWINQAKTGLSALALYWQLGVSYNTAWSMKHKRMQVMRERDENKPLSGLIQLDDVYWGDERSGKRGRFSENKVSLMQH